SRELVKELFPNELKLVNIADKGLMVYVCMDKCVYCARFIKETLSEPEVDGYLEKHFHQTTIDIADKDYAAFFKKYGVMAAPTSLFFAADGTFLSKRAGAVSKGAFMETMTEAWGKLEELEINGSLPKADEPAENEIIPELKIYPNPNNGRFTLQVSAGREPLRIRIAGENGKEIFNENIAGFNGHLEKEIDITGHAKGLYVLQILYGKTMYSEKIFVQ
ncbi:MAG TPA: T9SS type A sorting domain-containing protein, partial [Bacteroidetes bacterium]|nr:T9SS type A sorting domain-containing protein [Bacteroidota bacterium]